MDMPAISFVVPLYNEAEIFPQLVERLKGAVDETVSVEFLLVDDGSSDGTADHIRTVCLSDPAFHGVFLSRNYGHQIAISAGIHEARGTEALFILDGDLQDPPELFGAFYAKLKEGYDVVYAVREKRKEGWMKRMFYSAFYRIMRNLSYVRMPLDSGDFSLITRRVADVLKQMPEESRFVRGMRSWVGFRQTGLPYERDYRQGGQPKYGWMQLFRLAYNGIFNFSTLPIRFITRLGVLSILISLIYVAVTIYRKLVFHDVPSGFTALLMAVALFGGVQLVSLGIIGEYVLRIFFQVKGRPLFLVKERIVEQKSENPATH
ncbi:MAG: glycosyltransferase family 2 protein [Flavobacteriales bacterium]|nr:glycosyltransferase family 2 protein [Flavobacteriales bacterium]